MNPLDFFLSEKLAEETPRNPLDPGEMAMAGLYGGMSMGVMKYGPKLGQKILKHIYERNVPTARNVVPMVGSSTIGSGQPAVTYGQDGAISGIDKSLMPKSKVLGLLGVTQRVKPYDIDENAKFYGKLGEMRNAVDSFIHEHGLAEKGVTLNFRSGPLSRGMQYGKDTHIVTAPIASKELLLHELGHAADYTGSTLGKIRAVAEPILRTTVLAALPAALIAGDRIKEMIPGTVDDHVISFMQNHAPAIMGATLAATTLYPEAKASFLALKHLGATEGREAVIQGLKRLLPAWGTYALGAIPIMVGLSLAKKYMMRARAAKAEQLNEKTAGVMDTMSSFGKGVYNAIKDPVLDIGHVAKELGVGAGNLIMEPGTGKRILSAVKETGTSAPFVYGALASAVPATLAALYMYSTKGGDVLRGALNEKRRLLLNPHGPKDEQWRIDHPGLYAGLVGAGAALSAGILAKLFSDLGEVL